MIQVRNLSFSHPRGVTALRSVDLRIDTGERIALIGPNGSGKSTLARCLNGLLQPDSGAIEVDGIPSTPAHAWEIRRLVGMVFQNPDDQLVATSVESELAFGLENIALDPAEMRQRVEETLELFGLEALREHPPHQMSGGEKQRVAVAAAMALRPRYLILDEPTSLLDPRGRDEIQQIIANLHRDHGVATIQITQFPEEAARCERIITMAAGRIQGDAAPAEAFAEVDELRRIGLDVPFASTVAQALCGRVPLGANARLDEDTLADQLVASLPTPPSVSSQPAATRARDPKITTRDLVYTYDRGLPTARRGLDGVSVEIQAGSVVALVGASGSGKTTFAQHLNALLKPEDGQVFFDGKDVWGQVSQAAMRRKVGLVFQFPELQLFEETVALDVAFGPRNLGLAANEVDRRVDRALQAAGLPTDRFGERSPFALSGGEKRRAAIAGVLAMEPEVLVLDEPTAGLDPGSRQALLDQLMLLNEAGTTILLITHDTSLVAEVAQWLIVMADGSVHWQGPARLAFSDPAVTGLLAPPPSIRLLRALSSRGWPVPASAVTRRETIDFVLDAAGATGAATRRE